MLEMFALTAWEIDRIRKCVWKLVRIGDNVFSKDSNKTGIVVNKDITVEKIKIFTVDRGDRMSIEDPAYIAVI